MITTATIDLSGTRTETRAAGNQTFLALFLGPLFRQTTSLCKLELIKVNSNISIPFPALQQILSHPSLKSVSFTQCEFSGKVQLRHLSRLAHSLRDVRVQSCSFDNTSFVIKILAKFAPKHGDGVALVIQNPGTAPARATDYEAKNFEILSLAVSSGNFNRLELIGKQIPLTVENAGKMYHKLAANPSMHTFVYHGVQKPTLALPSTVLAAQRAHLMEGILECLHRHNLMVFKAPMEYFVPETAFSKFIKDHRCDEHDVINMLDILNSWYRKWPEVKEHENYLNYLAIRQHGHTCFKAMALVAGAARSTHKRKRSRKEFEG